MKDNEISQVFIVIVILFWIVAIFWMISRPSSDSEYPEGTTCFDAGYGGIECN